MSEANDYVTPPKKNKDYVTPPKKDDYVAPPKRDTENVTPKTPPKNDYVTPPKKEEQDYVTPPKKEKEYVTPPNASSGAKNTTYADPYENPSYFSTPKIGFKFYLTGYLIAMGLIFIPSTWQEYQMNKTFGHFFSLALTVGYILLSNYTYSWFVDYQRAKGGSFSWFFTPFGSVKAGVASSAFMNFQKGSVNKGWFGGYTTTSRTDVGHHIWFFLIVSLVLEFIKLIITIPLAFISIFLHKSTIKKYNQFVDNHY